MTTATTYAAWAAARLRVGEGLTLTAPEARRHYIAWVSDHRGGKREAPGKARAAILALDPSITRKGRSTADTVYHGVGLDVPPPEEAAEMLAALSALRDGGLITTHQVRRVAAVRLGQ